MQARARIKRNGRLGAGVPGPDADGESGIGGIPEVICPGVTSSTRLSQSFVLRFLNTFAAELGCNREVLSCLKLCSSATTRIDFLCLDRLSGGGLPLYGSGAGGFSAAVGDVPPELASITGLSRSWSGKKISSLSSTSSGLGREAHDESWNVPSDLDWSLWRCLVVGVRPPQWGRGGEGGGCLGGGGKLFGMSVIPPLLLELFICDTWAGDPPNCPSIFTVRGGPRQADFGRFLPESSSLAV